MADSFVFYKSFYNAIKEFDNDTIAEFFKLVCQYALDGEIIETDNKVAKALFQMTIPKIEANNKRRENGKKGGAPTGNKNAKKTTEKQPKNNQKQPKVDLKNNLNQPMVKKEEQEKRSKKEIEENILTEKEEKDNNYIIIQKEEKNFDSVFAKYSSELLGEYNALWRETITKKYGIVNHSVALDEFKAHIIAQGKEKNVTEQNISEFKAYFANSARMGVFSDKAKQKPKEQTPPKRKPCEFITQRTGQGIIGVIKQDGETYFVPQDVGYPPTESHYWNPEHRRYEVQ